MASPDLAWEVDGDAEKMKAAVAPLLSLVNDASGIRFYVVIAVTEPACLIERATNMPDDLLRDLLLRVMPDA